MTGGKNASTGQRIKNDVDLARTAIKNICVPVLLDFRASFDTIYGMDSRLGDPLKRASGESLERIPP